MTGEAFVNIGTAVIALIGAIITYMVVPYIKSKTTEKQRNDIVFWTKFAVNAAEQMDKAGILKIPKKDFVIEFLRKNNVDITDEQLEILIEAFVNELNKNK